MTNPRDLARLCMRMGLAAGVFLIASGCLTLESDLTLEEDGSGRLHMVYTVSQELYDYGVFDEASSRRILPLGRRDFELTATVYEGVELVSYQTTRRDGTVTVEATMAFADQDGLAGLLNVAREDLFPSGDGTTLRLPLFAGYEGAVDTALVEEFWSEVRFVHRVETPRSIRSLNQGEISGNGRRAEVDLKLPDLMAGGEALFWEVMW